MPCELPWSSHEFILVFDLLKHPIDPYPLLLQKKVLKHTNPARGILDFCKQKFWPLPCSQSLHSYADAIPDPDMMTQYDAILEAVMTQP